MSKGKLLGIFCAQCFVCLELGSGGKVYLNNRKKGGICEVFVK